MVPMVISEEARIIAEWYWGRSWTELSAAHVEEALAWWDMVTAIDRWLGP